MTATRRALDELLPIRQILVDGVLQQFIHSLDFSSSGTVVTVDTATGIARITFGADLGVVLVGATRETALTGPVIFGARWIAAGAGSVFRCVLQATTGMTARARLLDASGTVLATVESTSVAEPEMVEATLDLPSTAAVYVVDVCISAGSPGADDRAICHSAVLEVA